MAWQKNVLVVRPEGNWETGYKCVAGGGHMLVVFSDDHTFGMFVLQV